MQAPENTISAFRLAIEAGADAIELDVQASADGKLVVLNDATLDRTTDGAGAVFQTDWSAIERLDAGGWFSPDYTNERVPSLGDVLSLDNIELELELEGYLRCIASYSADRHARGCKAALSGKTPALASCRRRLYRRDTTARAVFHELAESLAFATISARCSGVRDDM